MRPAGSRSQIDLALSVVFIHIVFMSRNEGEIAVSSEANWAIFATVQLAPDVNSKWDLVFGTGAIK